jgi:hypothetical protein
MYYILTIASVGGVTVKGPAIPTGWLHEDAASCRIDSIQTSVERATKKIRLDSSVNVHVEEQGDEDDDDVCIDDVLLLDGRPDGDSGIVEDWWAD